MNDNSDKIIREEDTKSLSLEVIRTTSQSEQISIVDWLEGLLAIRSGNLSNTQKARFAISLTLSSKVVWPVVKIIASKSKRAVWDNRSVPARMALGAGGAAAAVFGGQGAGIAALGTAIGVPLWIVFAGGGALAGILANELKIAIYGRDGAPKTTYKEIDALKEFGDNKRD